MFVDFNLIKLYYYLINLGLTRKQIETKDHIKAANLVTEKELFDFFYAPLNTNSNLISSTTNCKFPALEIKNHSSSLILSLYFAAQ